MKAKAVTANRSARPISDALRRKLARGPSWLPILHALRGDFRDAVTEIYERHSELLAKQHAARVESDALQIRHALGDESEYRVACRNRRCRICKK